MQLLHLPLVDFPRICFTTAVIAHDPTLHHLPREPCIFRVTIVDPVFSLNHKSTNKAIPFPLELFLRLILTRHTLVSSVLHLPPHHNRLQWWTSSSPALVISSHTTNLFSRLFSFHTCTCTNYFTHDSAFQHFPALEASPHQKIAARVPSHLETGVMSGLAICCYGGRLTHLAQHGAWRFRRTIS